MTLTVPITINADTGDLDAALKKVTNQLTGLGSAAQKSSAKLTTLTGRLSGNAKATTIAATANKGYAVASRGAASATSRATAQLTKANVVTNQFSGGMSAATQSLIAFSASYVGVRQAVSALNDLGNIRNRLSLVTDSTRELIDIQQQLFDISLKTRSSFVSTGELYGRVALSTDELGRSQKELLEIVEITAKAVAISGATAESAAGGLVQFAQGLASNRLQGDELRSVLESLPGLFATLQRGLNVNRSQLRQLAEEGKLTAEVIINAILSQNEAVSEQFSRLAPTISQGWQQISTGVLRYVSAMNDASAASKGLNKAMENLGQNFEGVAGALAIIVGSGELILVGRYASQAAKALGTLTVAAATAAVAATGLKLAVGGLVGVAVVGSIHGMLKAIDTLKNGTVGATLEVTKLDTFISNLGKAGANNVDALQTKITELEKRIASIRRTFGELNNKELVNDTIDELTNQLKTLRGALSAAKKGLASDGSVIPEQETRKAPTDEATAKKTADALLQITTGFERDRIALITDSFARQRAQALAAFDDRIKQIKQLEVGEAKLAELRGTAAGLRDQAISQINAAELRANVDAQAAEFKREKQAREDYYNAVKTNVDNLADDYRQDEQNRKEYVNGVRNNTDALVEQFRREQDVTLDIEQRRAKFRKERADALSQRDIFGGFDAGDELGVQADIDFATISRDQTLNDIDQQQGVGEITPEQGFELRELAQEEWRLALENIQDQTATAAEELRDTLAGAFVVDVSSLGTLEGAVESLRAPIQGLSQVALEGGSALETYAKGYIAAVAKKIAAASLELAAVATLDLIAQSFGVKPGTVLRAYYGDMAVDAVTGGNSSPQSTSAGPPARAYHSGGVVGHHTGTERHVPPGTFANARRFHNGGLAGDEVPAILQTGERVLSRDEARNYSRPTNVIINMVNNGEAANVSATATQRDTGEGDEVIVDIVVQSIAEGGPVAKSISQQFGLTATPV
ncbi:tape measure protein [Candidatus Persebacteraceae bacterium Df01]|jgi:tape measure domain-containing protein|uniref:Tape measure protein n=1 Tax=Candidatus Doriopsillibacter californiensis TaxID=2970740 RepID=A0ABT7QMC3_9GAMM|nr:tape measure protein [Candidatus Persebacteraceae bacterium Df01]